MEVPNEVIWYGKNESLPEVKTLSAGSLKLTFEDGGLRKIKVGNVEVLRMIYMAVRDYNWGTILPDLRNLDIQESQDAFRIGFENIYKTGDIDFSFQVSIIGKDNQINFEIEGEALSEFRTNRVGFCVLHPIRECTGKNCEVTGPDGKKQSYSFPELISPHQPMKNIAEMRWKAEQNIEVRLSFEGDIFEMEDQRNWTDDSFKTYCRPLELPFPFVLKKGDKIHQRINLEVSGEVAAEPPTQTAYQLRYDDNMKFPLPKIGIAQAESKPSLAENEVELLRKPGFDYYDISVIFEDSWISELKSGVEEAALLGMKLGLRAYFSENFAMEIRQLSSVLEHHQDAIDSILILETQHTITSDKFVFKIIDSLRNTFPKSRIGGGTTGFFAELNRNRILSNDLDFISYSITPQVHAFDNATLIENLNGQSDTVRSATEFAGNKRIQIRPVTLKMQSNPAATSTEANKADQMDVRQMSLFGAGWTLGSIKYLTEAGAEAVTYYQTLGEKGIIQGDSSPNNPEIFHVEKGAVFPVYYVFHELLRHKTGSVIASISSHPNTFEGMVLEENGKRTFLLANYTNQQIEVGVDGISKKAKVSKLDEKSAYRAMYESEDYLTSPQCDFKFDQPITTIKMRPYAFVIINE
jgi:hypothetical protein